MGQVLLSTVQLVTTAKPRDAPAATQGAKWGPSPTLCVNFGKLLSQYYVSREATYGDP